LGFTYPGKTDFYKCPPDGRALNDILPARSEPFRSRPRTVDSRFERPNRGFCEQKCAMAERSVIKCAVDGYCM
jgi:hypothetical protein